MAFVPPEVELHWNVMTVDSQERSRQRWQRDRLLLEKELKAKPSDPRTAFYLAQTYDLLDMLPECVATAALRTQLGGWGQEIFVAMLRKARCTMRMGKPWLEVSWCLCVVRCASVVRCALVQ